MRFDEFIRSQNNDKLFLIAEAGVNNENSLEKAKKMISLAAKAGCSSIKFQSYKATQLASKIDAIIIMSGDSDYIELVRHLKSEGVRVEIAAVVETTANILIEECNFFHPLTPDDWYSLSHKKSKFRK